jgi:hypothetical protein
MFYSPNPSLARKTEKLLMAIVKVLGETFSTRDRKMK